MPMQHPTPEQLFALYDRELTGAAAHTVEQHLGQCRDCQGMLARWKQAAAMVFVPPTPPASEAFVTRVMRRLETPAVQPLRMPRPAAWSRWLVPAVGLAAVLLAALPGPLQQTVSTENLLLASGSPDDMWDLLMEDGP